MSWKGLRFTLDVDGLGQKTFAVVNFVLRQRHSFPFVLDIDVASDSFGETAEKLLEKNATLTVWQGNTPQRHVNRTAQRDKYPMLPERFPDNRISQDVENFYHYDEHGRLTEKDERRIHPHGSLSHHYEYDNQHRLTHYRRMQAGNVLTESRYLYDPLGRRVSKRVWACTVFHDGSCSQPALQETVWYGQDGDRLTTTQTDKTRIQTVYLPGSFTPLVRIETRTAELAKTVRRTLAEKFQQEANVTFPPELVAMVDNLEAELRRGELSETSRAWLAQCGLTPEQIQNQIEPEYTPERKIHLYHCDHRGLPLALIDINGAIAWHAEFDEWGNVLREDNPHNLEQLIRLPGQQYDKETGLYYNRHRYLDPEQGRYITQDPIGLLGGWNLYTYPLNPISEIDPLGLVNIGQGIPGANGPTSVHANPGPEATDFRPDHAPDHVHLGKNDGPRVSTDTWKPLSEADSTRMTKEQNSFCRKLSDASKKTLSTRQKLIFKFGKLLEADLFLLQYLSIGTAREGCLNGDMSMCEIFEMLGGEIQYTDTGPV